MLGDDYIALLTHAHTLSTPANAENKYVRTVRATVAPFDQLIQELKIVESNIANQSVKGILLTWLANTIGEPRPPWINDSDLLFLIHARIAANNWQGDMESARKIVQSLWPLADLQDNLDMTMTLTVPGEFLPGGSASGPSTRLYALSRIADAIRPMGVKLIVLGAPGKLLYWGTPPDTVRFGGWGKQSFWGGSYIITGA